MLDDGGSTGPLRAGGGESVEADTESPPMRSSASGAPSMSAEATTSPVTLSLLTTLRVPTDQSLGLAHRCQSQGGSPALDSHLGDRIRRPERIGAAGKSTCQRQHHLLESDPQPPETCGGEVRGGSGGWPDARPSVGSTCSVMGRSDGTSNPSLIILVRYRMLRPQVARKREKSVNTIGLGTFPLSGVFSPVEQSDANAVVAAFLDAGGSYIETAAVYPQDKLDLGAILAGFSRSDYFIATKCVTGRGPDGATVRSGRPEHIRQQCHDELRRLGVDNLDLLQLHTVPEDVPLEDAYSALVQLQEEGATRFIGASNVSIDHLGTLLAVGHVDYIQNRFSFLHRRQHQAIEEACVERGILLNPYQVIERGLLTDAPRASFPESDLRRSKYEYSGEVYLAMRTWVQGVLRDIAATHELSVLEVILGWTKLQPAVGVVPLGATTPLQSRQNLAAGAVDLPPEVEVQLAKAYDDLEADIRARVGLSIDEYRGL